MAIVVIASNAIGIFNAVAFAGAGYLFNKLNHSGYEDKIKRNNLAIEKLSKAKEKWYEGQVQRKEKIERLREQLSNANVDINDTNKSLEQLRKIEQQQKQEEENEYVNFYFF